MKIQRYIFGLIAILTLGGIARATAPQVALTGNLNVLSGGNSAGQRVYFKYDQAQNTGGSIIGGGAAFSVVTDSNGNLPTTGGCLPTGTQACPPAGAFMYVNIGTGPATKIQIPLNMTTVDLSTLILANTDPPSLVSSIASGNGNCTVINPSLGAIGMATITCTGGGGGGSGFPLTSNVSGNGYSISNVNLPNSSVNNVLTVTAIPYSCPNNSTTACTGIQQAIYDAEFATPPTFPSIYFGGETVYLPATTVPGGCYIINAPLRVASGPIEIKGEPGTCIQKTFAGPTFIQEAWGQQNMMLGACLVGTGVSNCSIISGSANPNALIDLSQFMDTSQSNVATFANSGFDIEFFVQATALTGTAEFLASHQASPGSGNGWFAMGYNGTPKPFAQVNTTGGLVVLTGSACPNVTAGTPHDEAVDWDGSNYRLFWDGTLCVTVASTNAPIQGPFESSVIPDRGAFDYWMSGGLSQSAFNGLIDDIRFEAESLHTSSYTPTTTRFVPDLHTWLLIDPQYQQSPTVCSNSTPCDGSVIAQTGLAGGSFENVYLPVLGAVGSGNLVPAHIHNIGELCPNAGGYFKGDAYFAQWIAGTEIDHNRCSNGTYAGFNFYNNDFGTTDHDNEEIGGQLGFLHGDAWNGSYAYNDSSDVNNVACYETVGDGGGGFHDSHQNCVNRGRLYYCHIFAGEAFGGLSDYLNCDQEAPDTNYVATILNESPGVAIQFNTPILTQVSGDPLIYQTGAGPAPTLINADIVGSGGSELIDFATVPTSMGQVINPSALGSLPLSNDPQYASLNGTSKVTLAQLNTITCPTTGLAPDGATGWLVSNATTCVAGSLITGSGSIYCTAICNGSTGWVH
jgi:concanavalin A-like lectin/glucanase superfamily protein